MTSFSRTAAAIYYSKYSLWGFRPSIVTFMLIRNPRWPPIGWSIFDFSRMASGIYSKLGTNMPYGVPPKCCYFYVDPKSKMATLASDWPTHFEYVTRFALSLC